MAKFSIELEAVLRRRALAEDQCQRELAKLLRERMILHHQFRRPQEPSAQSRRQAGGGVVVRANMDWLARSAPLGGTATQPCSQRMALTLASLEQQIEASRARLGDAVRARHALELLRDRYVAMGWRRQEPLEPVGVGGVAVGEPGAV
jgi:hypothetical protein